MIHEVTQAANRAAAYRATANRAAAIVYGWRPVQLQLFTAANININHGFTPPFTQPCCLLQFNKRLTNAQ